VIAAAANAEILVLPEYGLASASRDLVITSLPDFGKAPRLVVVASGRRVALPELDGPGVATLASGAARH